MTEVPLTDLSNSCKIGTFWKNINIIIFNNKNIKVIILQLILTLLKHSSAFFDSQLSNTGGKLKTQSAKIRVHTI